MSKRSDETKPGEDLQERLRKWLRQEGYPLEFACADAFRQAGFAVRQGEYTQQAKNEPRRELDIVAQVSQSAEQLLRVEYVVECKWSADKPWVLFGSERRMTTAACVSQSMATQLGETLLWKEAGNADLADLEVFGSSSQRLAFGGRQAFSGSRDQVFDALRAVTASCRKLADEYDERAEHEVAAGHLPRHAVVVFPVVVVDGRLFRAGRSSKEGLALEEVSSARIHWRGSDRHRLPHATLDIVRADQVEHFAQRQVEEAGVILEVMSSALHELKARIADGRLEDLKVTRAARGMLGRPRLIGELQRRAGSKARLALGDDEKPSG